MMPRKEEIRLEAQKMYQESNQHPPHLNAEDYELKESGIWQEARDSLMRNDVQYKNYIEQEARSLGLIDDKIKGSCKFEFDLEEGKRTGTMVIGGKGTGKTNLTKILARKYIENGCVVKVFDVSKTWVEDTPIPRYVEVAPITVLDIPLYESIVFDLSHLYVKQIKSFIAQIIAKEFQMQVNTPKPLRKWIIYIFEDSVVLLPRNRLSSIESEEILRLITVGRNYDLSYIGIVQRPSLTDTSVFELCFQKYIGRLDGENDKRKLRSYIGGSVDMLDSLRIGEFLYDLGETTKKISVPLFSSTVKPLSIKTTMLEQPKQPEASKPILGYIFICFIFIGLLVLINAVFR